MVLRSAGQRSKLEELWVFSSLGPGLSRQGPLKKSSRDFKGPCTHYLGTWGLGTSISSRCFGEVCDYSFGAGAF